MMKFGVSGMNARSTFASFTNPVGGEDDDATRIWCGWPTAIDCSAAAWKDGPASVGMAGVARPLAGSLRSTQETYRHAPRFLLDGPTAHRPACHGGARYPGLLFRRSTG